MSAFSYPTQQAQFRYQSLTSLWIVHLFLAIAHSSTDLSNISSYANYSWDYMVKISEPAVNRLMPVFAPLFSTVVMDMEIPAVSSSGLDTQPSYFESFDYDGLVFHFNDTRNSFFIQITGIDGSINAFDFVAKQKGIFTEMRCRGNTAPTFTNWSFSIELQVVINGSCDLEMVLNEDDIDIIPGDLSLNYEFENGLCNSAVVTVDKSIDLDTTVKDLMVDKLPPMMSTIMKDEINSLLYVGLDHQSFGLESNGTIDICYTTEYMQGDQLMLGIDFIFDAEEEEEESTGNSTVSSFEVGEGYAISGVLGIEWAILCTVIFIGFLIGNCCMICSLQCMGKMECCECCSCCDPHKRRGSRHQKQASMEMASQSNEHGTGNI